MRGKVRSRLVYTLLFLLGLGVLLALLGMLLPRLIFSPARLEALRKRAEAELSLATGGRATIGPLRPRVSLIHGLHVHVPTLAIDRPRYLSKRIDKLSLEEIRARFDILGLVRGKARVTKLEISSLTLTLLKELEMAKANRPVFFLAQAATPAPRKPRPVRLPFGRVRAYVRALEVGKAQIEGLEQGPARLSGLRVDLGDARVDVSAAEVHAFGFQKGWLNARILFPNPEPLLEELTLELEAGAKNAPLGQFFDDAVPALRGLVFQNASLTLDGRLAGLGLLLEGRLESPLHPNPLLLHAEGRVIPAFHGLPRIERAKLVLTLENKEPLLEAFVQPGSGGGQTPGYALKASGKRIPVSYKPLERGLLSFEASCLANESLSLVPHTLNGVLYLEQASLNPNPDVTLEANNLRIEAKEGELFLPAQTVHFNKYPVKIEGEMHDFKKASVRLLAPELSISNKLLATGVEIEAATANILERPRAFAIEAALKSFRVQKLVIEQLKGKGTATLEPKGQARLQLSSFKASMLGGTFHGPLVARFGKGTLGLETPGVSAQNLQTESAFFTFSKKEPKVYLKTKASGPVRLIRPYGPANPFQAGLQGSGELKLTPGQIHGLFLYKALQENMSTIPPFREFARELEPFVRKEAQQEGYFFDTGNITFSYQQASWHIREARLTSLDGVSLEASGRLMQGGAVDGQGTAVVSERLSKAMALGVSQLSWLAKKKQRIEIPVSLSGNIKHVKVRPDIEALGKAILPNIFNNLLEGIKGFSPF
jgi:hypothetical protein